MTVADELLERLRRRVLLREILALRGAGASELRVHEAEIQQVRQKLARVVAAGEGAALAVRPTRGAVRRFP
jgi:hypothetical protein